MDKVSLFIAIRQIADYICDLVEATPGVTLGDRRMSDTANPYYHQSETGLFLEMYYGTPSSIWTPWGKWGFGGGGSGDHDVVLPQLIEHLGLEVYTAEYNNSQGTYGPVYKITKFGDLILPEATVRDKDQYMSYEDSKEEWKVLCKKYYEDKGGYVTSEELWEADRQFLAARSASEPPINDTDIKTLAQLEQYLQPWLVLKYTTDQGKTWTFTRLETASFPTTFQEGSRGYRADEEVMPNVGVHSMVAVTDKRFERGMIMRLATKEEAKDVVFSYDNDNHRRPVCFAKSS